MAKNRFSIILDYRNAMKQAGILDETAEELKNCSEQLERCGNRVRGSWTGENADKYINSTYVTSENIGEIRKNLINISEAIKRIAERTYDTEMAALEISGKRTY